MDNVWEGGNSVKFKTLMVIKAAVSFIFGIPMAIVPCKLLPIFGVTLAPGGRFTARCYGAALIGFVMLCWFARNAEKSDTRRAIIISLFVYDLVGFIVALYSQLKGVMNGLGWLVVCIYLFFTVTFCYFFIRDK
jgi:hypothetical protein